MGKKEAMKVLLIEQQKEYFQLLQKNISPQFCKKKEIPDFIHLFVKTKKEFEIKMKKIKQCMKPTTIIWVSWYKKSAGITTDIVEHGLENMQYEMKLLK